VSGYEQPLDFSCIDLITKMIGDVYMDNMILFCTLFAADLLLSIRSSVGSDVQKPHGVAMDFAASEEAYWQDLYKKGIMICESSKPILDQMSTLRSWIGRWPFARRRYLTLRDCTPETHPLVGLHRDLRPTGDVRDREQMLSGLGKRPDHAGDPLVRAQHLVQYMEPPEDPNFLRTGNPALPGKLLVNLLVLREESCLHHANQFPHIFALSHLYNALVQSERLSKKWPALEQIITIHIKPIFMGERPSGLDAMFKRAFLAYGCPPKMVTSFGNFSDTKNRWKTLQKLLDHRSSSSIRSHLTISPMMAPLCDHFHGKDCMEGVIARMDKEMVKQDASPLKTKHLTSFADLGAIPFLKELRRHTAGFSTRFEIDYIEMTRICNELFHNVSDALIPSKGQGESANGEWKLPHQNGLKLMMGVIMELNDVEKCCAAKCEIPKDKHKTPLTDMAATIISNYIDSGATGFLL
jgi:hypothetical protein